MTIGQAVRCSFIKFTLLLSRFAEKETVEIYPFNGEQQNGAACNAMI